MNNTVIALQQRKSVYELNQLREENEREKRKLNIVVGGIDVAGYTKPELAKKMQKLFQDVIHIRTEVTNICILRPRMFKITVSSYESRHLILTNRKKLTAKGINIYLYPDRTPLQIRIRSELRNRARLEEASGKVVQLFYNSIVVNGIRYVFDDQKNKIVEDKNSTTTVDPSANKASATDTSYR